MGRIDQLFNVINQAVKDKGIFYVIKRASFILIYLAYQNDIFLQKNLHMQITSFLINLIALTRTASPFN